MHPLNPVLSSAVLNEIAADRLDAASRAHVTKRRSPLALLRGRLAARRGAPRIAATGARIPARARRA